MQKMEDFKCYYLIAAGDDTVIAVAPFTNKSSRGPRRRQPDGASSHYKLRYDLGRSFDTCRDFQRKVHTTIRLDAPANATYAGSFRQVVSRLLDDYDYVIRKDRDTTEIFVFGTRGRISAMPFVPHEC